MLRIRVNGVVHIKRGDFTVCGMKTHARNSVLNTVSCEWCVSGQIKPKDPEGELEVAS